MLRKFSLFALALFMSGCQANRATTYNSPPPSDYLMEQTLTTIKEIAGGKVAFRAGGQRLLNSTACSPYASEGTRTVCTIGALSAFEAAEKGYNGRAYYALVDMKLKNEVNAAQASMAAQNDALVRAQLLQTGAQLLGPQGTSSPASVVTFPTSTRCHPNGSQVWCSHD